MAKFNFYILFCSLFVFISCKNNLSSHTNVEKNYIKISGSLQSSEIHFIYPPKNTRTSLIKNIVEEGSIVKKGDFIAEFTPQNDNSDVLNKKQNLDKILQEKSQKIEEVQNQIQKNIGVINKDLSDIEIFNKTRDKNSIEKLAQFIPLNTLKIGIIDNKISINSLSSLKEQNIILKNNIHLFKENYDRRIKLLQKNLALEKKDNKFLVTADSDGIVFSLKNWQKEKFIKGSNVYESQAIIRIENTNKIQIICYLPEENRELAQIGQAVKITIYSSKNIEIHGKIKSISKIVMPLTNWDAEIDSGKLSSIDPLFFQLIVTSNSIPNSLKPSTKVQVLL